MTSKHLPAAPVHPPTREGGRTGADPALSPPAAQLGAAALSPSPWGAVSAAGFPRGRRRPPPRGAGLAVRFGPPSGPLCFGFACLCVWVFLPVTLRNIPGRETESLGLRELTECCFQLKYLLGTLKVSNVITMKTEITNGHHSIWLPGPHWDSV